MSRLPIQQVEPICIEDGKLAVLATGREVWPDRPEFWDATVYRCACGAWIGCHRGTEEPEGYPAGPHTRRARKQAEEALGTLIQRKMNRDRVSKGKARLAAHTWLAGELGIELSATHFKMMDAATARRVVALCMGNRR